jgi:hypothetical protein
MQYGIQTSVHHDVMRNKHYLNPHNCMFRDTKALLLTQRPAHSCSMEFKCLRVMWQEGNLLTRKIVHSEIHTEMTQAESRQEICMFAQCKIQTPECYVTRNKPYPGLHNYAFRI